MSRSLKYTHYTHIRSVCTHVDYSWAVGAYESGRALAQEPVFDSHHVLLGYAFGDAHHQRHLCVDGLDDGRCSKWRGYINDGGNCPRALLCLKGKKKKHFLKYLLKISLKRLTEPVLKGYWKIYGECEFVHTSLTELKTGRPRWFFPPLPGETPPTNWEP